MKDPFVFRQFPILIVLGEIRIKKPIFIHENRLFIQKRIQNFHLCKIYLKNVRIVSIT